MTDTSTPAPTPDSGAPAAPAAPAEAPATILYPSGDAPADAPGTQDPVQPAQGEPAPDEGNGPEAKPAKEPAPPAEPAPALTPEAYKDVKLPEGMTSNKEALDSAYSLFAEAGVKPEAAQKLVDWYGDQMKAAAEAQAAAFTDMVVGWRDETLALPEFSGKDGEANLATIGRAIDEYGSPEVRKALEVTGAGNNPAIAQWVLKMSQALSEGSAPPPGRPKGQGSAPETLGQRLYGK